MDQTLRTDMEDEMDYASTQTLREMRTGTGGGKHKELAVGAVIEVRAASGRIFQCTVINSRDDSVQVHYNWFSDQYDEWIQRDDDRLVDQESPKQRPCSACGHIFLANIPICPSCGAVRSHAERHNVQDMLFAARPLLDRCTESLSACCSGCRRRFQSCHKRLYTTFSTDPSTRGVRVADVGDNPFHKELSHGEAFRYGFKDEGDDSPVIRIHMKRVMNPYFRLTMCLLTCGVSEVYYRFVYVLYASETCLAMTDLGRILIWTNNVKGQQTTLQQMLLKAFATRTNFYILLISIGLLFLGNLSHDMFGLELDLVYFNMYLMGGCLVYILYKFLLAFISFGRRRVSFNSQTQMRSFLASDLCATSFTVQHDHGLFGRQTTSEMRLFFGRYPEQEDIWSTGQELNVHDLGLVETNLQMKTAGGDGTSSISEGQSLTTQPWWIWVFAVANTCIYLHSLYNWVKESIKYVRGDEDATFDGMSAYGFVADFLMFVLTTKAWLDMRNGALLNQKPVIRITDKHQSNLKTSSTDTNFTHYISEVNRFLGMMAGLAVEYGQGFRPMAPQAYLAEHRADAGKEVASGSVLSGKRQFTSIRDLDVAVRRVLVSSESFLGDSAETVFEKYAQFITLIPGETIMAIYPYANQSLIRRRILSVLTLGIWYLVWRFILRRTHGAVIVTTARVIQVSVSFSRRSHSVKLDTFIVDDSLRSCSIEVPHPRPCTWNHGLSKVHFATRLGDIRISLPKTHWYKKCMIRMWQALSMVNTNKAMAVIKSPVANHSDSETNLSILLRWTHFVVQIADRLELRVIRAYTEDDDDDHDTPSPKELDALQKKPSKLSQQWACGIGLKQDQDQFFDVRQTAPTLGRSWGFSDETDEPKVFTELGSMSREAATEGYGFAVHCWLSCPEDYRSPIVLSVSSASLLICAIWVPRQQNRRRSSTSLSVRPNSPFEPGGEVRRNKTRRATRMSTTSLQNLDFWLEGESHGWKKLTHEWQPPFLAPIDSDDAELEGICYSLEVHSEQVITVPSRPCPATIFGGPLLWDDFSFTKLLKNEPRHHREKFTFPRPLGEEILWNAALKHERPDFLWMKLPVPALIQQWTITTHRLITVRVEPLTKGQKLIRKCVKCLASPPKQSLYFYPLHTVAGFVTEECLNMDQRACRSLQRKWCGRSKEDTTSVSMKLLTRFGAKRIFPEGAAVSQMAYLDQVVDLAEGAMRLMLDMHPGGCGTVSSALYAPIMKEIRWWGTAVNLALATA
jgi:hypothetical protein